MSLTVKEKEHWKDRIGRRIDKKIDALAAADPNYLDRIADEARARACASLGLTDLQAQLDAIEEQDKDLKRRRQAVQRAILATVRRVPVEDVTECYFRDQEPDVVNAIRKRQAVHEEELLAADERGRAILRLRRDKDDLLDTVWLATSPVELKDLWQKVSALLGEPPTELQQAALAIGAEHKAE